MLPPTCRLSSAKKRSLKQCRTIPHLTPPPHGVAASLPPNPSQALWDRLKAARDAVLPAPPHDRTGHTWHHDDELLFEYTKLGGNTALEIRGVSGFNSGMPAFGETLTDGEIWDVLAYIRSTWSEQEQQVQESRNPPH